MITESTASDLVERSRRGDREAFAQLFERYKQRLAVLIHYKLPRGGRSPETVEEILQKTNSTAFEYFPYSQFSEPGSCLTWLSGIADHVVVNAARRNHRKRRALSIGSDRSGLYGMPRARIPIDRDELEMLTGKLDSLSEQHRSIILLARIEGLSTAAIAERLNQPHEEVVQLLHEAVQCFRGFQIEEEN